MQEDSITFQVNVPLRTEEVIALFERSGIRRPVADPERIGRMIDNANLIVTAWDAERLVGIARALTDFSFCCYLSDLAVEKAYQRQGIGRELIEQVRQEIGQESMLLLLSAPEAMAYYPKVGFEAVKNGWIMPRGR